MIITLTLEEINIKKDDCRCTFSAETLDKLSSAGLIRRCKKIYKLHLYNREFQLECPMFKHPEENIVLWPASKIPYRKYPVYVYLFAVALYLSSNLSMRRVAAIVRQHFGLATFSHSTLCRVLQKLTGNIPELLALTDQDHGEETPPIVLRKNWNLSRQEQYCRLLNIFAPVLNKSKTTCYGSFLNYRYYHKTKKFLL
jgi:hypothetical protein